MAWSAWKYKDTNVSVGKYRLWYRVNNDSEVGKAELQYKVEVQDSGNKQERWNCVVVVKVDGKQHSKDWSNKEDSNVTDYNSAVSSSTVAGHSGYITGYVCIGAKTVTKSVGANGKASWKLSLVGGFTAITRRDCTCEVTVTGSSYTNGTKATVTITEDHRDADGNYYNKVTFSGTLGKNGANNSLSSATLYYTLDGTNPTTSNYFKYISLGSTSGASYSKTIDFTTSCTFKAMVYCKFAHNNTSSSVASGSVKYCTQPTVSTPTISYNKSRLTIKEPWKFSWTGKPGTNCAIVSYRVRLYRKAKGASNFLPLDIKNSTGTILSTTLGNDKYYDTGDSATNSLTVLPVINGFQPGDAVKISVYAQGETANTKELWWSGSGFKPAASYSNESVVQNAGVLHPSVNSQYVEGVVWACIPDATSGKKWVEADVVKVCVPDGTKTKWVEAE